MIWLVVGLVVFHGIHSLRMIAPGWRDAKVALMGENAWKGAFSFVSLVALVLIIWGYSLARPETEILYVPPDWGRHLAIALMAPAFILMTFNLRSSRFAPLIKHPFLTAIMIWSIAHLFANGDVASVLLFGSFLIWAIINRYSAANRNATLPPVAPLFQDILAAGFGLVLWVVFIWKAHEWLFGVSPIA